MAVWQLVSAASNGVGGLLHRGGHTSTAIGDNIYVLAGRKGSRFYKDLLVYDTRKQAWRVLQQVTPLPARANHMAVCIGGRHVWVIGGADENTVFGDVWVLDVQTLTWSQPKLRGAVELLTRCSAGCDIHPTQPHVLLLFGGYGQPEPGNVSVNHHNDLVRINTSTGHVTSLSPSGPMPKPRCFHTFTTVDDKCWVVGGRVIEQGPLAGSDMVAVYDPILNSWLPCEVLEGVGQAHGTRKEDLAGPRSSHKAVAVGSCLLVTGGNLGRPGSSLAVWLCLEAIRGGAQGDRVLIRWSDELPHIHSHSHSIHHGLSSPAPRAAHGANLVGTCVYLSLGYTEVKTKAYLPDVLKLLLDPAVFAKHPWPSSKQLITAAATATTNIWELCNSSDHPQGAQPVMVPKVQTTVSKAVTVDVSPKSVVGKRQQQQQQEQQPGPAQMAPARSIKVQAGHPRAGGRSPTRSRSGGPPTPKLMDAAQRPSAHAELQTGIHAAMAEAPTRVDQKLKTAGGGAQAGAGLGGKLKVVGHGSKMVSGVAAGKRTGVFDGAVVDLIDDDGTGIGGGDGTGWQRKKSRTGTGSAAATEVTVALGHGHDQSTPDAVTREGSELQGVGRPTLQHEEQQQVLQPGGTAATAANVTDGLVRTVPGQVPVNKEHAPASPQRHYLKTVQSLCPLHEVSAPSHQHLLAPAGPQQPMCTCPASPSRHMTYMEQVQVQHLQQQVQNLQQQLNSHQQQLADQQRVLHESHHSSLSMTSLSDQVKQLRGALDESHKSVAQLRAAQATLESELGHTKAALAEAQKQATNNTLQYNSLRSEKQQWMTDKDTLQQQHNALQHEHTVLQQQYHKLQQQNIKLQARCSEYEACCKSAETSLEALQASSTRTAAQYEQRLAAKDAAGSAQAAQIGELQAALTSIQAEYNRSIESNRTLQQHLSECRDRLAESQRRAATECEAAGVRESELRQALQGKTEELGSAQQQLAAQAAELAAVKAQNERLTAELAESRHAASTAASSCQQLNAKLLCVQATIAKAAEKLTEDVRHAGDSFLGVLQAQQQGPSQPQAGLG